MNMWTIDQQPKRGKMHLPGAERVYQYAIAILLLTVSLYACDQGGQQPASGEAPATHSTAVPNSNKPVAERTTAPVAFTVNGMPVTEHDIKLAAKDILGENATADIIGKVNPQIRQSLMIAKVISEAAIQSLNKAEIDAINAKVTAYRDILLMKEYLIQSVKVKPVTAEMVRSYYAHNPKKFGARTRLYYERLSARLPEDEKQRSGVVQTIQQLSKKADWPAAIASGQYAAVKYKKGDLANSRISEKLKNQLLALAPTEVSNPIYADKAIHLLRLIEKVDIPPSPLARVSAQIRANLVLQHAKEAITNLLVQRVKNVTIVEAQPAEQ